MRLKRNKTDIKVESPLKNTEVNSFIVEPKNGVVSPSQVPRPTISGNTPVPSLPPITKKPKPKNFSAMEGFAPATSSFNVVQSNAIRDIRPPEKKVAPLPVAAEAIPVAVAKKAQTSMKAPIAPISPIKSALVNELPEDDIDDDQTEDAIEDIVISESNELLAAQDAALLKSQKEVKKKKKDSKIKRILKSKWLYFSLGLIVIAIFAVPYSRYYILGKFVKNEYQFSIVDSTTNQNISGATIDVAGRLLTTDSDGQAKIVLGLGQYNYTVKKPYYQTQNDSMFIGLTNKKAPPIKLAATGRQVPVTVLNMISGRPLSGALVSVLGTNSKTNKEGLTYIVLPTSNNGYLATVTATDYNAVTARIQVSTNVNTNTVRIVPKGSVYYLANKDGKINVVKSNLDGSDQQVELAGTGSEQASTTHLYSSPDWKYLVLEAQRSGTQTSLYYINTITNQTTEFDGSDVNFKVIGWSGNLFIYDEVSTSGDTSVAAREQIKSFNPLNQKLIVLDQNLVNGSGSDYAYQSFYNFELLPTLLVYNTEWTVSGTFDLGSSTDAIRGVGANGLNKKDYYTFPAISTGSIQVARYAPSALYFNVANTTTNQNSYYNFAKGAVTADSSLSPTTFSQTYPPYYLSPSGEATLWTTSQNGQLTSYSGDQNGQNQKLVRLPAGFSSYQWYDNVYILLSQAGQLYISPSIGSFKPTPIGSFIASN
ncbi:MAG TPA: hypothetical protein VIH90_02505 [Candidatus Saccharimonadales bacterium]